MTHLSQIQPQTRSERHQPFIQRALAQAGRYRQRRPILLQAVATDERRFASLLVAMLLALALSLVSPLATTAEADTALDRLPGTPPAPEFQLSGPNDEVYRLADFKGQPLVVNFWATWCPPCRAEMPAMQRAWEQLKPDGINLIAINVGEDAETVQAFLEQVPVSFPLPLDPDSEVAQQWPMRGLPTTFVVAPDGRILYKAVGEREWDHPELLEQLRALKRD
jgi:peroxiredoxin